jgi:ABC-type transporter Mla subunit MlaD
MWKINAGAGDDNLAKVRGQRDDLAKQLANRDAAISDLADRVERTMGNVAKIVAENSNYRNQNAELIKKLTELPPPRVIVDNVIARADQLLGGIETALADVKAKTADMAAG